MHHVKKCAIKFFHEKLTGTKNCYISATSSNEYTIN